MFAYCIMKKTLETLETLVYVRSEPTQYSTSFKLYNIDTTKNVSKLIWLCYILKQLIGLDTRENIISLICRYVTITA